MEAAGSSRGLHRATPRPQQLDDALQRARAGDESGFVELFTVFQPRLLRYLQARCGSGYQDVASDTWLRIVTDLHKFSGDATDFASWLFTIARYRAIDAARMAMRHPQPLPADYDAPDTAAGVEETAVSASASRDLLRLVGKLPPDQADAVALRILGELDVATVARLLDKSANAVRISTHRGLRRLEELLQRDPEGVA